jgi:hypothetical protein
MNKRDQIRDEVISKARKAAEFLGKDRISIPEFQQCSGLGRHIVEKYFDGWREVCQLAGLAPPHPNRMLGDDEIFDATREAFLKAGGDCSIREI